MTGKTTWTIGNDPASDLWVDRPSVSWKHCLLSRRVDGSFTVEDLGSTNGTFVNGRPVLGVTPVRLGDSVTLGQVVLMPWPDDAAAYRAAAPAGAAGREFRVGREPDNDVVIDNPSVSARHARVLIAPGGKEGVVEDLGSTNGTAVGAPGNSVARAAIAPGDVLFFGTVPVQAATFFASASDALSNEIPDLIVHGASTTVGRDPGCERVVDFPMVSGRHARLVRAGAVWTIEDLGSSNGTFVNGSRVGGAVVVKPGDLIGLGSFLVRLVDGSAVVAGGVADGATSRYEPEPSRPPTAPLGWEAPTTPAPKTTAAVCGLALGCQSALIGEAIVYATGDSRPLAVFLLSLAAVWIGLSTALAEPFLTADGEAGPRSGARSLAIAFLLDAVLCAFLLRLALARAPFAGHVAGAAGLLCVTAMVGSAFGHVLFRLTGRSAFGFAAVAILTAAMGVLGGPARPLPSLAPAARAVAQTFPSRWAFEGLMSLSPTSVPPGHPDDPVEPYFPAASHRMGLTSCVTALVALLGGFLYAEVVIATTWVGRRPRGEPGRR